ncbi:GumC family protein [Prosthecobacter sp.]|jgi:capsular exopolysaccharide synthesis family protein|uniref:GumC family protein n=1 Tax=Prosthecobacter sp. TaxID=1965333 RepID=UPI0037C6403B
MNPAQLVDGVRRHSWIPITLALFGLILGYAYFKRQKPVYEAVSVAQFGSEHNSLLGLNSMSTPGLGDEKSVNTLIQAAKSREVIGRVVTELNLTRLTGFSGGHPNNSKEARENAISTVSSMVRISLRKDTRLIDFNVTGADPEQVASLSNQAVLSLVAELESQKSKTMQGAVQALVAEGQRLQDKLTKSEIAMHDYKRSNQAISLDERKDLVLTKLKELGSELNHQSKERLTLETQLKACKEEKLPRDELLSLPTIASHPKVSGILTQLSNQKSALALLAERYKPKHPKYESVQAVIINQEQQLTTILADAVHMLESSCEHARELERRLQEQLKKQESEALDLEQLAVQYNVLKREMESDQAVYESVLTRIKQVDVSKGMETPPIWVHQLAMVPGEPVSPNAKKVVGSSTAGGFMLGLAIIGLIVMQDRSIRSVEDARQKLRVPVLGMIANLPHHPDTKDQRSKEHDYSQGLTPALIAHKAVAESFREFRAIIARMAKGPQTCHMVVSAIPDEGKTFVSTHLAVSLASQGYRTLLIDMDLRRSQLAQVFGIPSSRKGVIDLLLEEASFAEVCLSGGIAHLAIMPAGKRVANPAELLSTCGVERLKDMAFAAGFDRIVIDTAPLIPVNDTLELGGLADSTFLVVRCNRTPSDIIQEAIRKLQQTGIPLTGLILNRLAQRTRSYDYYYHRSYYKAGENEESAPLRPVSRGFNSPQNMG